MMATICEVDEMCIDWNSLPATEGMRRGSDRRAISGDYLSAVRVRTEPDADFDPSQVHHHANEQLLVMIGGQLRLLIDGKEFVAGPGDMAFFPPGSRHAAIGVGPEGAEYYEIFAPARLDQLPGFMGRKVLQF